MKIFKKIMWGVLVFHIVLLIYVVAGFKVDDMTLSKGEAYAFNDNWTLTWQDGSRMNLETLPYLGKSEPGERLVLENTIPKEFFGKTMSFLSADKTLQVYMDEVCVYEFGISDVRSFGKTPGSVVNFIDIPVDLSEGKLRIEMSSPYADYGARVKNVLIGERDILILQLLKENIPGIACNLLILFSAMIFMLLFLAQKVLKQDTGGVQYLCGYCIVAFIYYSIETKTMHIFYGNQTLYSVLVFLCLMMLPFFINLYYGNSELGIFELRWKIMLGIICTNIVVQMILQLGNLVDFMNMAFCSHALIMLTIVIVGKSYVDILKKKKKISIRFGMAGLLFMGIGGSIDIVRMYVVAVGDMGKFSRLGTVCFCIIMGYQHLEQMIRGYSYNIEKSAKLLQREMEIMEKKNEELKVANALAEEARQDAIFADAAKGKFLAHMSHEIRTPINAVLGMDTMILREAKDMQIKEYALDIQNAGQNLLSLINDILDFSKIESGKLEIIQVEYDLSSLIHDIANMIVPKAEAKKLKLEIYVDEQLPSRMLGDDVRIRQVLVNLLNNAVKYTQEGSVILRIKGKMEGRKAILDFSVEDTGIGIKEEDIARLFKEFERIEEKRNRHIEGSGLGMNITAQLLNLMGSKINVESVYGKGSRFYFTLEQQVVDSTPIGDIEERIRKKSTEYEYMATFVAPKAQVLVVDDNLTNLKVFVSLLKRTNINVDVVDSGKGCLEMVTQKCYDLIFLDHMMPEMDGIETLHELKALKNNLCVTTPVIALTANAITGAKEMYLAEGFDAFLPKPINPEKLEQMILRLLPRDLLQFDVEEEGCEPLLIQEKTPEEIELPMIDGIDWSYGLLHLPGQELLLETVTDFYKAISVEADTLEKFYQECKQNPESIKQYRIKVHSMKSSANLIGAIVLGGMAKMLENAARSENMTTIDALHDIFITEWRSYKEKLQDCIKKGENEMQEKEALEDKSLVMFYLEELQKATEELDMDEMDQQMALLEAFAYPEKIQEAMEALSVLVVNMDYKQILTKIENLQEMLENE